MEYELEQLQTIVGASYVDSVGTVAGFVDVNRVDVDDVVAGFTKFQKFFHYLTHKADQELGGHGHYVQRYLAQPNLVNFDQVKYTR